MSDNVKINDENIFQSFSKDYIFNSNREPNKTSQNENLEFTFRKNLFIHEIEESPSKSKENQSINNNKMSSTNFQNQGIYSKNDNNILESGDFGKSKYNQKKYKDIIENNVSLKQPIFYVEEKSGVKYIKPNTNINKFETVETKFNNKTSKKFQSIKAKSCSKLVTSINKHKNKKIMIEPNYCPKGRNVSINNNDKKFSIYQKENIKFLERKTNNYQKINPVLNRIKKMENKNYYNVPLNNPFNRTNNDFTSSQFFLNKMKILYDNNNNNSYINFISINNSNDNNNNNIDSKIKKIKTSNRFTFTNAQQKLKPKLKINMNNIPITTSRNTKLYIENKENIPLYQNINTNPDYINHTIINFYKKRPLDFQEINRIKSTNYKPQNNFIKISKYKNNNNNEKKINPIQMSNEYFSKLKNEMRFNPYNNNNFLICSKEYLENTIQSKLPRTNRNKNNGPFFGKKLNTIYNKSIGALKISNKNCRVKILNNNNSKNKIFAKSLITKENFGY